MSGHSHWATTHRQKGVNDSKRAAVFTKYARLITVAAREGGDPTMNYKLRLAVDNARGVNMPKDNIDRAIKVGTGELKDANAIEEVLYEAYGPGQIALLIEGMTDNKNRAVSEVKTILTKNGGKFVPSGSVSFLFRRSGIIVFSLEKYSADILETEAIESGADDFKVEEEIFLIITQPETLQSVQSFFEEKKIVPESASLGYLPAQTTSLSETEFAQFEKLKGLLEDNQDVQTVWDNLG